jgi:hypothetical protein
MRLSLVKVHGLSCQCLRGDQGHQCLFVRGALLLMWSQYFMDGMWSQKSTTRKYGLALCLNQMKFLSTDVLSKKGRIFLAICDLRFYWSPLLSMFSHQNLLLLGIAEYLQLMWIPIPWPFSIHLSHHFRYLYQPYIKKICLLKEFTQSCIIK